MRLPALLFSSVLLAASCSAQTAKTPWPHHRPASTTLPNFTFGTGEALPKLKLHYLTLGTPHRDATGHTDNAVLLLHGTGGDAHSLLNPVFSNVLFVPGAALDITKYFLILPDDIGQAKAPNPPTASTGTSPPTTTTTWSAARSSCSTT